MRKVASRRSVVGKDVYVKIDVHKERSRCGRKEKKPSTVASRDSTNR
jgi:hypothetical protein